MSHDIITNEHIRWSLGWRGLIQCTNDRMSNLQPRLRALQNGFSQTILYSCNSAQNMSIRSIMEIFQRHIATILRICSESIEYSGEGSHGTANITISDDAKEFLNDFSSTQMLSHFFQTKMEENGSTEAVRKELDATEHTNDNKGKWFDSMVSYYQLTFYAVAMAAVCVCLKLRWSRSPLGMMMCRRRFALNSSFFVVCLFSEIRSTQYTTMDLLQATFTAHNTVREKRPFTVRLSLMLRLPQLPTPHVV